MPEGTNQIFCAKGLGTLTTYGARWILICLVLNTVLAEIDLALTTDPPSWRIRMIFAKRLCHIQLQIS